MTATAVPAGPLGPPRRCPTCDHVRRDVLPCMCSHPVNAPGERGHLMDKPYGRQRCLHPGCGCGQYRPDQEAAT